MSAPALEPIATQASPFWLKDLLPAPFHVVFTTRIAGVSTASYESLNLALHVGDNPRAVRENRRLVCQAWNLSPERTVAGQQVHGNEVALVEEQDAGRGAFSHGDAIPGVDALVTRTPGLPLISFSADCLLIALADPGSGVLGLLHAGWRGLAAGVIERTLAQMAECGADLGRVHAVGSPSIGPCCFEVGPEVVSALGEQYVVRREGDKAWLDLRAAAIDRLMQTGVARGCVRLDDACTCCRADLFFSHRRATRAGQRNCGRMAMLAWIG